MALYEELRPDDYVNLSYFSSRAGETSVALSYKKKAYETERSGVSAYNLAVSYPQGSEQYMRYMEEACLLDWPSAKVVLAEIFRESDPERACDLMSEASNHYRSRFEADPDGLGEWEYRWVERVADYEHDHDLKQRIKQSEKRRQRATEAQRRVIDEGKLLEVRTSSGLQGQAAPAPIEDEDGPEEEFIQI